MPQTIGMSYLSPFELLPQPVASLQEVDAALLRKAKRRLLAEFELGDGVQIEVGERKLDKAQALNLLGELQDKIQLRHHWTLYKDPFVTRFLKNPDVGALSFLHLCPEFKSPSFKNFFSPYLAEAMSKLLGEAFDRRNWQMLKTISSKKFLLNPSDCPLVFRPLLRQLRTATQQVEHWVDFPEKLVEEPLEFSKSINKDFIRCANALPNQFMTQRNNLALALTKLSFLLAKDHEGNALTLKIVEFASKLELDEETRGQVEHLRKQFYPGGPLLPGNTSQKVKLKYFLLRLLIVGAGIVVVLGAFALLGVLLWNLLNGK